MENKIYYPDFQQELQEIGLILREHKQHRTMKGVGFEAIIESELAPVTLKKGAVYQNLQASGRTPNEVAKNIFKKMTESDMILIGTYEDYKEKVVFENGAFKRVPLSKEETVEVNSVD